jgi:alpha-amylase
MMKQLKSSKQLEIHDKIVNVTNHDGRPFSTGAGTSSTSKFVAGPGGSVLMQGFYWDVPDGGNWWNTVKEK